MTGTTWTGIFWVIAALLLFSIVRHYARGFSGAARGINRAVDSAAAIAPAKNAPLLPIAVDNVVHQGDERFYLATEAQIYQVRTHYDRTYSGGWISYRIASGLWGRSSRGRSHSDAVTGLRRTDAGRLILSDKRLLFLGRLETIEIPLEAIAAVDPTDNGLVLHRAGCSVLEFVCDPAAPYVLARLIGKEYAGKLV